MRRLPIEIIENIFMYDKNNFVNQSLVSKRIYDNMISGIKLYAKNYAINTSYLKYFSSFITPYIFLCLLNKKYRCFIPYQPPYQVYRNIDIVTECWYKYDDEIIYLLDFHILKFNDIEMMNFILKVIKVKEILLFARAAELIQKFFIYSIMMSIEYNHIEMVLLLIKELDSLNRHDMLSNNNNFTANGAIVRVDSINETLYEVAITQKNEEMALVLIKRLLYINNLDVWYIYVLDAARDKMLRVVKFIMENKLTIPDPRMNDILANAVHNGDLDMFKYLIKLKLKNPSYMIDPSIHNNVLIGVLVEFGHLHILKYIINSGIDKKFNISFNTNNNELCCVAAQFNRLEILKYLVSLPKEYGINPADRNNEPIKWAYEKNNTDIIEYLKEISDEYAIEDINILIRMSLLMRTHYISINFAVVLIAICLSLI